jgi:hypothetical protein
MPPVSVGTVFLSIGTVFLNVILPAAIGAFVASLQLFLSGQDGLRGKPTATVATRFLSDIAIAIVFAIIFAPPSEKFSFLIGVAVPFVLRTTMTKRLLENKRAESLRRSVEKAQEAVQKEPEKPKNVWDLSQAKLDEYINRNLSQVKFIFAVTVVVMAAGFAMVAYGVYRAYDTQLQIAIVSAASGIITQAIGATFLFVYRSTLKQANDFVGMLERINAVGMAVSVVEMIPDDKSEAKTMARVDLLKQILSTTRRNKSDDGPKPN